MRKKAFSLIELLIVISILGIMAAIVLPTFQSHLQKTKEAAAKDNLRIFRNVVELYTAQHNGRAPGYFMYVLGDHTVLRPQLVYTTDQRGVSTTTTTQTDEFPLGPYLKEMPANPFNEETTVLLVGDATAFPPATDEDYGWIYKPATKTVKINWTGTDTNGVSYDDY